MSSDPILKLCTETPVTNVRNFCILAHVDHGKTTISDHLLTTNGLLSSQLAGQVRYLDSRPDEQERLITMKASSVALCHKLQQDKITMFKALEKAASERAKVLSEQNEEDNPSSLQQLKELREKLALQDKARFEKIETKEGTFVCNLLDCPGHIDFSSEVAAAVRLTDGAVIVVDLVDGVTMVTRAMLRQCYIEGLPMVLLLNKLDYIILKMKLTPEEGLSRMQAAVSECNAFLASCVNAEDIAAAGVVGGGASSANLDEQNDDDDEEGSSDDEDDEDEDNNTHSSGTNYQKNPFDVNGTNSQIPFQHRALEVPADEIWFCPTKGNVVFASGLHGFGFQLSDFAALYKEKLPKLSTIELTRGLWGEHFLDAKTMSIMNKPKKEGTPCLGLTLFCEPLWKLHTEFEVRELDEDHIREMLGKIGLNPRPGFFKTNKQYIQDAINRHGAEGVHLPKLFQLLGEWMPLSKTLLDATCCQLPCPLESQRRRAPVLLPESVRLLHNELLSASSSSSFPPSALSDSDQLLSSAVKILGACSRSETAPLYAFVAKLLDVQYLAGVLPGVGDSSLQSNNPTYSANNIHMESFGTSHRHKNKNAERGEGNDNFDLDQYFVALTRIYSGRIRAGQMVCVDKGGKPTMCKVEEVYILRGQGLEPVPFVAAGNICAIRGCSKEIIKCATLCEGDFVHEEELKEKETSSDNNDYNNKPSGEEAFQREFAKFATPEPKVRNRLPFITPIRLLSSSVVQLAVTPQFPDELGALLKGLKFLHQTDPQVELAVLPSGDHVIRCAGEVHAERCVEDLRTTFARVNIYVTDPIVGLRETIDNVTRISPNQQNVVKISLGGNDLQISVAAISLPSDILEILMSNATEDSGSAPQTAQRVIRMMKSAKQLNRRRSAWKRLFKLQHAKVVAWGPEKMNFCGNLLIDTTGTFPQAGDVEDFTSGRIVLNVIQEAIVSGFELGTSRGPMADEPMFGIAFIITNVSENFATVLRHQQKSAPTTELEKQQQQVNLPEGVFTGHIVSSVAQGCRQCFQANAGKQRIVEPVYECLVYSAGQTRGKIYSLLHRRRASIGEEILQEGTDMFSIKSYIPATESFGLQDELRTLTSGAATAQLRVDHWEVLDVDPYYKPTTKEELEEQGTNVDKPNLAMTIIEQVRKRKGLYREQVVKHAEKQSNKFSMRGA